MYVTVTHWVHMGCKHAILPNDMVQEIKLRDNERERERLDFQTVWPSVCIHFLLPMEWTSDANEAVSR